jgi:cytidine deaminase
MKNFKKLYEEAYKISEDRRLGIAATCGGVASALITKSGTIYTGICIDVVCGIGFCAEHSAVAEMLKHGESEIKEIIAVVDDKRILPPCGRCRELVFQIHPNNKDTIVHLSATKHKTIKELLPNPYVGQEGQKSNWYPIHGEMSTEKITIAGLAATIHRPDAPTELLAILSAGYLDSKDYPHLLELAERLARRGYTVVRYDPTGTWESEGAISDYTIAQQLDDIKHILEYMLRERRYLIRWP